MSSASETLYTPVNLSSRIISLDVLRGFALLGILIMNVQHFSMPGAAYINPDAYGDLNGINKWVWVFSHILASEKFMSIFSLLFGAGILLFTENAVAKEHRAGPLHYRRMFWLFVFGMIHAYLIWSGDILVAYSLCGMLAFVFKKKQPQTLIWISLVFLLVPFVIYLMGYFSMPYWSKEEYQHTLQSWKPLQDVINKEITVMQGGWMMQMESRVPASIFMQTFIFVMEVFWRVMSMMLLGMALYKWKILSAERTYGFYTRMMVIGLLAGFSLSGLGVILNFNTGWEVRGSMFLFKHLNYFGSVAIALGYTAMIMLLVKSARCLHFKNILAATGRMAFSNYILMSLIGTFIFYGHGLALFGTVERKFQVLIMMGIWLVVMIISPLWLKYFRFGPLEWLWRSLTYWRRIRFND